MRFVNGGPCDGVSLSNVNDAINTYGYFVSMWYDIIEFRDVDISRKKHINEMSRLLSDFQIDSLPKIVNGVVANVEKDISASRIVFFRKNNAFNKLEDDVKFGMFVAKVAAVTAKIDGYVTDEEIKQIRHCVYALSQLSQTEKYGIFIRALYYLELGIKRDTLFYEFDGLSDASKSQVLNIVSEIVISDLEIARQERFFLYELYRLSGRATNTVAKDLRHLAKLKGIQFSKKVDKNSLYIEEAELPENEGFLDDLFRDFEGL